MVLNPSPFDRKVRRSATGGFEPRSPRPKVRCSTTRPPRRKNHPFSNCYPSRINAWGCVFETVEPAYQYKRAIFEGDRKVAMKIKATRVGRQAKRISKTIKRTRPLSEWKAQRRNIMWSIVRRKFNDVPLKQYLLSTGEVLLVEWVKSWKCYWGLKKSGGIGQNTLG